MKPESLEQLVGSGNVKVVEEQWLALLEDPAAALATIGQYDGVLSKLVETGNREQAEQFAWAAVESLASVHPAADVVPVAGKFLLALGDKSELRGEACKLYRTAFPEQDALDDLLTEAGLEQGRPVRRALRTLDVCLELSEGDFVAARDDDGAARIERIDLPDWTFTLDLGGRTKELGAVYLADGYHKVGRAHFNVMRRFFPDELAERVRKAPATIIIELCRQSGNTLDSDDLEYTLVPAVIAPEKWKKWFTSARTALRKDAHVKLEGRGPWTIQYQEAAVDPEAEFRALFDSKRTPEARFAALEAYLRDCKTRGVEVAAPAVQTGYDWFITRAREHTAKRRSDADRYWLFARRIEQLATVPTPAPEVLERIADVKDLLATVRKLKDDAQIECFCLALIEARPDTWQAELRALFPQLPSSVCETVAQQFVQTGAAVEDWEPVVEQILSDPLAHFDALLWVWNRPSDIEVTRTVSPLTVLARMLDVLEQAQRLEAVSKERAKHIGSAARTALGARRYVRFKECIAQIDPAMGKALRTQINRLDNLGRAVREDVLKALAAQFPEAPAKMVVPLWEQEEVLYSTAAGLARRQREVDELVNVKMRENAKAIGEAAEKGDLSENSEYKFALEERDLLRARLAQMNQELDIAQVLDPAAVPTHEVGIGTRVHLERLTDQSPFSICFLGPWDTSKERYVFNYKTPLAERFLGRRVGDEIDVELEGVAGRYRIVALESELAD